MRPHLAALGDPIPDSAKQRLEQVLVVRVRYVVSCRQHLIVCVLRCSRRQMRTHGCRGEQQVRCCT